MHYFDNSRVSKRLVQDVHLTAELQGIDDEVLLSGGDLHQTGEAEETPVGMVLRWRKHQCLTSAYQLEPAGFTTASNKSPQKQINTVNTTRKHCKPHKWLHLLYCITVFHISNLYIFIRVPLPPDPQQIQTVCRASR